MCNLFLLFIHCWTGRNKKERDIYIKEGKENVRSLIAKRQQIVRHWKVRVLFVQENELQTAWKCARSHRNGSEGCWWGIANIRFQNVMVPTGNDTPSPSGTAVRIIYFSSSLSSFVEKRTLLTGLFSFSPYLVANLMTGGKMHSLMKKKERKKSSICNWNSFYCLFVCLFKARQRVWDNSWIVIKRIITQRWYCQKVVWRKQRYACVGLQAEPTHENVTGLTDKDGMA